MAEIKISGNKLLKTLKAEFQKQFEYLTIHFYSSSEWNKSKEGESISHLDSSKRISEVRLKKPEAGEKEISIHGRTLVKNLEKNFKDTYGICVQVCYRKNDGQSYYTSGAADDMSLTQLNKYCEEKGYTKHP